MNSKRKSASQKENWQAIRRRFTWHLRGPFKREFDCSHWWKGKENSVEPRAALYELARRHPLVREMWLRNFAAETHGRRGIATWIPSIRKEWKEKIVRPPPNNSACPPSLYWTCLIGLRSWALLDYGERRNWESSAGKLKGLDFRGKDEQGRSIRFFAHGKLFDQRREKFSDKAESYDTQTKLVQKDLAKNPPTAGEWEAAIAEAAIEAHRRGYVLLGVVPDLTDNQAEFVMLNKYQESRRLFPSAKPMQRARWQDWLPLISEFEDAELLRGGAKAQIFVRYRRALEQIRFT